MTHHLANAFQMRGHQTYLLAPRGAYVPSGYEAHYRLIEDFEARPRRRENEPGAAEDDRIRELVSDVLRRYHCDLVFLMHPFYYGYGVIEAAKRFSVPVSVAIHGLEWRSQTQGLSQSEVQSILGLPHHRSLRQKLIYVAARAHQLIANSTYTAQLLAEMRPFTKITVAGCGLDHGRILHELKCTPTYDARQKQDRRRRLGISGRRCLAYVGRLIAPKAIHRILTICAASTDMSAVIVGDGPDRRRLEDLTRRKGLSSRIHFIGEATEEQKWAFLRAADAVCLLSVPNDRNGSVEGFGIALLEGAAGACIPISSGTGGMSDVVEDGVTGLLLRNDSPPAVAAVCDALYKEASAAQLIHNAREQLQNRFSWDAVIARIESEWVIK